MADLFFKGYDPRCADIISTVCSDKEKPPEGGFKK
jgi:hypothetical protein